MIGKMIETWENHENVWENDETIMENCEKPLELFAISMGKLCDFFWVNYWDILGENCWDSDTEAGQK